MLSGQSLSDKRERRDKSGEEKNCAERERERDMKKKQREREREREKFMQRERILS
jgi:hypothetical protein